METPITSTNAAYLKHVGKLSNVKVSLTIRDGKPVIQMRDREFYTFTSALHYLQEDARALASYHIATEEVIG